MAASVIPSHVLLHGGPKSVSIAGVCHVAAPVCMHMGHGSQLIVVAHTRKNWLCS